MNMRNKKVWEITDVRNKQMKTFAAKKIQQVEFTEEHIKCDNPDFSCPEKGTMMDSIYYNLVQLLQFQFKRKLSQRLKKESLPKKK